MKIFGVTGEKIWGEDKQTQDFTFNNYPVLELRDPKTTNEIADSLERNWNQLDKFGEEMGKREDSELACMGAGLARQWSELLIFLCFFLRYGLGCGGKEKKKRGGGGGEERCADEM